jgi:hypothetical protein
MGPRNIGQRAVVGDGEVDQVAQGARFKGEFDTNWVFIIGANLQYRF